MSVEAELQQAWKDHGGDPEAVALRLDDLCARAGAGEVPAVAGLVVHVLAEHLGRYDEADERLTQLARHGESEALLRSRAVLRLCRGEDAEILLDAFGAPRATHEARILAIAAGVVAERGRVTDAGRGVVRAASLSYGLPDQDPAVRSVAITANNLACALEERPQRSAEENSVLRSSSQLARAAWERAGTWREVERAEYRLAMTHLVLGEPLAAVTHALACRAICAGNDADAGERLFAAEALSRALSAAGDADGAKAAAEVARTLLPSVPPGMAEYAAQVVAKLG
jgi:hypothetical protein